MGSGIAIIQKRQQLVQAEMSGENFNQDGVYGFDANTTPYVPSSAPLPSGDLLSPKGQAESVNPSPTAVNIVRGQDNSIYLPKTTGTDITATFENGRPNISISVPSISYTEIANSFIQAILRGEKPQLPQNIRTTISITPPRDSSGDRGAASVESPLSNATPNTTTTTLESSKIRT